MKDVYKEFRRWAAGRKGICFYQLARLRGSPNAYLKLCYRGVIHVGANDGQEIALYSQNRLKVVWIEAIPSVYENLKRNIQSMSGQVALNHLIADRDGSSYTLHVSNNDGQSSSIYDLHQHKEIWPTVHYVGEIKLQSVTLPVALRQANIRPSDYEALVLDTQGSELLVLKGATEILENFRYIKTEAADFELYKDGCTEGEIVSFLENKGFRLVQKHVFAERAEGGSCSDLLFERTAAERSLLRRNNSLVGPGMDKL